MLKVGDLMYYVSRAGIIYNIIEIKLIRIIPMHNPVYIAPDHFDYIFDLQGDIRNVIVKSQETAVQDIEATGCVFVTKEQAIKCRMQLLQDRINCLQSALEEAQADLDNIIGVTHE